MAAGSIYVAHAGSRDHQRVHRDDGDDRALLLVKCSSKLSVRSAMSVQLIGASSVGNAVLHSIIGRLVL